MPLTPTLRGDEASGPAVDYELVTPSDLGLGYKARALWIGTTGNVTVKSSSAGAAVQFLNVPVGWFEVNCTHVMAATTASNIVAIV